MESATRAGVQGVAASFFYINPWAMCSTSESALTIQGGPYQAEPGNGHYVPTHSAWEHKANHKHTNFTKSNTKPKTNTKPN